MRAERPASVVSRTVPVSTAATLSAQISFTCGRLIEASPLIGIQPEKDIHLPVALPKRGHRSAGESTCKLARNAGIRQSEAIGFLGAYIHAGIPGIVIVIIANVGCEGHVV